MRASIIIAARNEGAAVARTVEACVKTAAGLDYELVLVDDASTDGSVDAVFRQLPTIRRLRHDQPRGASPAKAAGADRAMGDVLVFLDGHTNPAHGAILELVQAVERLEGRAIVTPAVAALDVTRWRNDLAQTGHGYVFDLQRFDCRWLGLAELRAHDGARLYESPALIGCAFAISRELYDRLWGFDPYMRSWGTEDLDLALKAWLADAPILHDPQAVVGHHFRTAFDNYRVPVEDVLFNQIRMARKHFTETVWEEWLTTMRASAEAQSDGRPEGIWACAWHQFESDRSSVEQERAYLQALRVHDEFWYARRFDLPWPRLYASVAANGGGAVAAPVAAVQARTPLMLAPSPSPAPCRFTINGPADVPGLTQYQYEIALPPGKVATNIQWQSDKPSATFQGPTNQARATVNFAASIADFITLKATFVLDGVAECATTQVALVRLQLGDRHFDNPGRPATNAVAGVSFLVNPPAPPTAPHWVTRHVPGSAAAAFTYNGTAQAGEPGNLVNSRLGAGQPAGFTANTTVKLTAPPEKPTALQRIQVGFMQAAFDAGNAQFGAAPNLHPRNVAVPTTTTIDWLSTPPGATDEWPWYDANSKDTGTGTGTWARRLDMADSPGLLIPGQYNPNNPGDPNHALPIANAHDAFAFQTCIAARTLDTALQANTFYFDHGHSTWVTNFAWPMVPNVSIVTFPAGTAWTFPAKPTAFEVNVVPTVRNHNNPYIRWIPAKFIDYTPDITANEFWDSHEVTVVRVDSVEGDPGDDARIHTHLIRRLNATASRPDETYALRDIWFTPDPEERLTVQPGDTLVLYLGAERPIVAQRIAPPVEDSALVRRLEQIASLRLGEGGDETLRESTLHEDPTVARYALRRLLEAPQMAVPDEHVARLRQAREEERGDPVARLLAAELAFQRDGKDFESDEAYQWLQASISSSTAPDWTQIDPFVRRLVAIDRRRSEAVAFLTRLAADEGTPEPVRIAAYGGFEPLIYEASPQEAEQLIDACFQMLQSKNATIRSAGATLLYNFSVRGGPGPLGNLATRAAEALRNAQRDEADDQVRTRLERLADMLATGTDG